MRVETHIFIVSTTILARVQCSLAMRDICTLWDILTTEAIEIVPENADVPYQIDAVLKWLVDRFGIVLDAQQSLRINEYVSAGDITGGTRIEIVDCRSALLFTKRINKRCKDIEVPEQIAATSSIPLTDVDSVREAYALLNKLPSHLSDTKVAVLFSHSLGGSGS